MTELISLIVIVYKSHYKLNMTKNVKLGRRKIKLIDSSIKISM